MSDKQMDCYYASGITPTEAERQAKSESSLAAPSGPTVPFSEANLDRLERATLTDGIIVECGQDRRVEVWRVKEEEGFAIRIFRPTNDGKTSMLIFGLKPPAAQALCSALSRQLSLSGDNPK